MKPSTAVGFIITLAGLTELGCGVIGDFGSDADKPTAERFSFFVISYEAIQILSGTVNGFGGDLRYGETGAGAGLRGADAICAAVAERSMAKNGKSWRAFLSVTDDGTGNQVDAIDRVGNGPFYDRMGRLVAQTKADLVASRPIGADAAIRNDLPNEHGVPNQAPDGEKVDNHDILTGSNAQGTLYGDTSTCSDWTSSVADPAFKPRVGHSWPRATARDINDPVFGDGSLAHWISALDESGCGAGVNLIDTGSPGQEGTVGSGGGYGGFYCFALTP